jgi:hypothetical protein
MVPPDDWPELPPAAHPSDACRSKRDPLECPHCAAVADPPYWMYDAVRGVWASERCSACGNPFPDDSDTPPDPDAESVLADEWFEERENEHWPEVYEATEALGMLEDGPLTVAVRHTDEHGAQLERLAAGRGDGFQCVARLVREPADGAGRPETVRVELYGATVGDAVADARRQQKVINLLLELEKLGQHAWVPAEVQRVANGKFTVLLRGLPERTAERLQFDPREGSDPPVAYTLGALALWLIGSLVALALLVVTGEPWPVIVLAVAPFVLGAWVLVNGGPYVMSRLIDAEVWLIRRVKRLWRPVMFAERLLFLLFWAATPLLVAFVLVRLWPGG